MYTDDPNVLAPVGIKGITGLVNQKDFLIGFDTPEHAKWLNDWHESWKNWDKPYETPIYQWNTQTLGQVIEDLYWLFDVVERAGTTDSEKIIDIWEGDEYKSILRVRTMRACDHQAVNDTFVAEFVHPNPYIISLVKGFYEDEKHMMVGLSTSNTLMRVDLQADGIHPIPGTAGLGYMGYFDGAWIYTFKALAPAMPPFSHQ